MGEPSAPAPVVPAAPAAQAQLKPYVNRLGWRNKLGRLLWGFVYYTLFRFSPRPCHFWRRALLRLFGATIGPGAHVYSSARIWAPWNLRMGAHSALGPHAECYCVAPIAIGAGAWVSQYAYLCSASHDISREDFALVSRPITVKDRAWIAACAFVGPGVTINEGAVVAACAVVVKDVAPWMVVGGNPAKDIKRRELSHAQGVL